MDDDTKTSAEDLKELASSFDFHGKALDDIFETYKPLRRQCPVGRSEKYGGFWFVMKSDDIFAAERDPEHFSVAPSMLLPNIGTDEPMIPIDIDPPEHTAYRRALLPYFTPQIIEGLVPGMREVARGLVQEFLTSEDKDVSRTYARPMPGIVFSRIAGFPEEDWMKFDRWIDEIFYGREDDPERAYKAGGQVRAYFDNLLDKRQDGPRKEDLIQVLLEAEVNGRPLTRDELLSYCYLLFAGGLDTTAWAIRSSLWYLAQHPEDQQRLREDPDLVSTAGEEFLRTMAPVQGMARTCKKDTTIRGQEIKAGDRLLLVFGSGNRDPEAFEDPDTIKIDRQENKHLAFGAGHHRCLGSNLGRRELVVGLQEFLAAVPSFSLADPTEVWHGVGKLALKID